MSRFNTKGCINHLTQQERYSTRHGRVRYIARNLFIYSYFFCSIRPHLVIKMDHGVLFVSQVLVSIGLVVFVFVSSNFLVLTHTFFVHNTHNSLLLCMSFKNSPVNPPNPLFLVTMTLLLCSLLF